MYTIDQCFAPITFAIDRLKNIEQTRRNRFQNFLFLSAGTECVCYYFCIVEKAPYPKC